MKILLRTHKKTSKIKPFISNCNWRVISFPSDIKDWRKFESNNKLILLYVLFVENDKEEVKQASISNNNFKEFFWWLQLVKNNISYKKSALILWGVKSNQKAMVIIIVSTVFIHLQQKINLKLNLPFSYKRVSRKIWRIVWIEKVLKSW